MMQFRTLAVVLLLTVAMLSAVACSGDNPQVEPTPTPPSTSSPSPTPSPSASEPGGPPAGWEDSYTTEELSAYEAALARWQRFRQLLVPLEKEGKYTAEAEKVFQEYRVAPQAGAHALRAVEANGYRFEVPYEPLWSIADSVQLSNDGAIDGAVVVISQCTDYSGLQVTKDGKDVSTEVRPEHQVTVLLIQMTNLGGKWKYIDSTLQDEESCSG